MIVVKSQLFPREKTLLAEHLEKACFEQRALKHSSHVAFTGTPQVRIGQ